MDIKDKIDGFFRDFINLGPEQFYYATLSIGSYLHSNPSLNKNPIEEDMLNLSYEALKRAREIEEQAPGTTADDWRLMSFLYRKIAHKLFREFNSESTHLGFLRLVK